MRTVQDGLILKVQNTGSSDRLCTILTRDNGVIRAFAKKANNFKNKNHGGTSQLTYGSFCLFEYKGTYTIDECEPKESFFSLRENIEKLALAQYFCEIAITLASASVENSEFLRVILNSLHMLGSDKYPSMQIKAVLELRMLRLAGLMPDVVMCRGCGKYESRSNYIFIDKGYIMCSVCAEKESGERAELPLSALTAMRHILLSDFSKIFSFSLSEANVLKLSQASERYLMRQTEKRFTTLDFYKALSVTEL